ncbi:hypothetical protein BY996DRAFT_4530629, partial [Phakopsora pachyrhizi]
LNMICRYWSLKRKEREREKAKCHLFHGFQPWTAANPASHQNQEDRRRRYDLLVGVRDDLQQVKNLVAMICKREKVKMRKTDIQKDITEQSFFPTYPRMRVLLNAAM